VGAGEPAEGGDGVRDHDAWDARYVPVGKSQRRTCRVRGGGVLMAVRVFPLDGHEEGARRGLPRVDDDRSCDVDLSLRSGPSRDGKAAADGDRYLPSGPADHGASSRSEPSCLLS
jgi:hypothetical protein